MSRKQYPNQFRSRCDNRKSKTCTELSRSIEKLKWAGFVLIFVSFVGSGEMAQAQQPAKEARIGVIGAPEEPRFSEVVAGLKKGLNELGYAPESLSIIEVRVKRADEGAAKSMVQKLLQQKAQVLFLIGSRLVKPAREASAEVPIVFITPGDPVSAGLVASLPRPGGNTTAMTFEYPELSGKRLELLREMAPRIRRVLILYDPRDPSPRQGATAARDTAPRLGITLVEHEVRSAEEVMRGLDSLRETDAFVAIPGGLTSAHYKEIITTANAKRKPTMFYAHTGRTVDALASYGANDAEIARQATRAIDKILKGANAGELPVERPRQLELVINLKTAKQLGLTIPPSVLVRADKVIK